MYIRVIGMKHFDLERTILVFIIWSLNDLVETLWKILTCIFFLKTIFAYDQQNSREVCFLGSNRQYPPLVLLREWFPTGNKSLSAPKLTET